MFLHGQLLNYSTAYSDNCLDNSAPSPLLNYSTASSDNSISSKELNLESNELFVLSCCNTARGKVTGDGILGLLRSLMCAGATNMIVTLWPIHDSSTSVLMKNLYLRYRLCRDAPASLCYSMLYHIQQQYKEEHWAAFHCLGVNILASSYSE